MLAETSTWKVAQILFLVPQLLLEGESTVQWDLRQHLAVKYSLNKLSNGVAEVKKCHSEKPIKGLKFDVFKV